jgi:hypothetical protein
LQKNITNGLHRPRAPASMASNAPSEDWRWNSEKNGAKKCLTPLFFYFLMWVTRYLILPAGAETKAMSPIFNPIRALPTGL